MISVFWCYLKLSPILNPYSKCLGVPLPTHMLVVPKYSYLFEWISIGYFRSRYNLNSFFSCNEFFMLGIFMTYFNQGDFANWLVLRCAFIQIKKSFGFCTNYGANLSRMQRNNYIGYRVHIWKKRKGKGKKICIKLYTYEYIISCHYDLFKKRRIKNCTAKKW